MLYLGIDQHKRQVTINLRAEDGTVILKRQVSTQWEKVRTFFADLAEKARPEGGFLAILEVCGMNAWLLDMLQPSPLVQSFCLASFCHLSSPWARGIGPRERLHYAGSNSTRTIGLHRERAPFTIQSLQAAERSR